MFAALRIKDKHDDEGSHCHGLPLRDAVRTKVWWLEGENDLQWVKDRQQTVALYSDSAPFG